MKFLLNPNLTKYEFEFCQQIRCSQTYLKTDNYYKQYLKTLSKFWSFIISNKESMNNLKTESSGESKRDQNNSWTQTHRNETRNNSNNYTFNGHQYENKASTSQSNIDFTSDDGLNSFRFFNSYSIHQNYRSYENSGQYRYQYHYYSQNSQNLSQDLSEGEIREMVGRFRKWNRTSHRDYYPNNVEFSVMTYNILSQNLLENHSSLYRHCNESSIKWPERGLRIVRELQESNADIMCLQEVHSEHFKDLIMPALQSRGYASVFKQKTGDKLDGCAIIYNENKFTAGNSVKLELMRTDLSSILDRDNIAIILELKPKQLDKSDTKLIVANTHLLFNPRRGDVKMAQIRLLFAEIDKIALKCRSDNNFDYHPILLCGDFNTEPNSPLYNFIRNGSENFGGLKVGNISGQREGFGRGKDVEHFHFGITGITSDSRFESLSNEKDNQNKVENEKTMLMTHNFKFRSVYPFVDNHNKKLVSTSNYYESSLVDYIFYETNSRKLKLIGFEQLMNSEQINRIGNIPNAFLGSDHLSLKAKFLIR